MYFVKTPKIARSIIKKAVWNIPNNDREIFLTFDDGPTPSITNQTLDILSKNQVKATFFCLGKQVEKHPEIFQRIIDEGHAVGNHSYSHLKGWTTDNQQYLEDIRKGEAIIKSNLFRPPYGKIKRSQVNSLSPQTKIILWDVLPGDFSLKNNVEKIVSNTLNSVETGSIIVLHDNNKCGNKMLQALPVIIDKLKEKKYSFTPITEQILS
jgi:peptidoglycan/xylan/chitin deacetylase (PgdA/CDA1 family)